MYCICIARCLVPLPGRAGVWYGCRQQTCVHCTAICVTLQHVERRHDEQDPEPQRKTFTALSSCATLKGSSSGSNSSIFIAGSTLGRVLTPTLGALGAASCAACVLMGDRRGELALQCWAALLLPALHLCLPVYTLSAEATLSCCWFLVTLGSVASSFEAPDESDLSTAAIQNLLLACGAASLHRTLMKRAPICQY